MDSKVLDQVIGPDGQAVSALIKNGGSIKANGGSVFMLSLGSLIQRQVKL